MKKCFLLLALLFCAGCSEPKIQARTFYTSRADLASYVIDTPDPDKSTKGLGQVLWISWSNPSLIVDETTIDVILRFKNEKERKVSYPIVQRAGWLMVEITPEERQANDGILSYHIELRQNKSIIASTKHKLWVEKITITN